MRRRGKGGRDWTAPGLSFVGQFPNNASGSQGLTEADQILNVPKRQISKEIH